MSTNTIYGAPYLVLQLQSHAWSFGSSPLSTDQCDGVPLLNFLPTLQTADRYFGWPWAQEDSYVKFKTNFPLVRENPESKATQWLSHSSNNFLKLQKNVLALDMTCLWSDTFSFSFAASKSAEIWRVMAGTDARATAKSLNRLRLRVKFTFSIKNFANVEDFELKPLKLFKFYIRDKGLSNWSLLISSVSIFTKRPSCKGFKIRVQLTLLKDRYQCLPTNFFLSFLLFASSS